ncbi:sodium/sugar symporter [Flavilitoribacter nigricans]|uniref:Sodium/glucose cotransporter n=1 Tax=Flavilitoribacter nigricans (strain ATCC 23147 / DSM 23189 / NBRC 102662 / NCIMB 1420 / SS-2) TaxID=1122177 RepID=A0A2D0MY41_FLAN2|nr:sodium/sugar symporter [Flavilitoribacter nigricans]PHN01201.1 sodium/glucose cotransporter [Flavilitoribacter nigricans DSM 23189 = NBRC 102662]
MGTLDIIVFIVYALVIISLGLYMSRTKAGEEKTAEDYFLAGKSLPWWAIGASLIAANISAEQMIGMSGQGFGGIGLAIASYEFMAAVTLIIVAKYFMPIFIKKGLYTIPDFVEQRFSVQLKTILAIFWIALFTFINLTTVLLLGSMALDTIIGTGDGSYLMYGILGLAFVAAAYSLYGGLAAVAWTDVLQVSLLILGGLITTYLALDNVTPEGGVVNGLNHVLDTVPEKFHMILDSEHPSFNELPGIAVLVGGMWIANLYYWGFNQYIIQRALAAKDIGEAQKGLVFAGFLKLLIPLIVVIPGIVAYVYYMQPDGTAVVDGAQVALAVDSPFAANDNAYPWLISTFIPSGIKGLVVAALAAAIVSSLASMMNSISTIFTMDIYREHFNPTASESQTVKVGRIAAATALVIAIIMAPLLSSGRGIFNVIQEYTGLVSPGILAIFILGLFWKKTTNRAAILGAIGSIAMALIFKFSGMDMPWMNQMGLVFLLTCGLMILISYLETKGADDPKGIPLTAGLFKTSQTFNIGAFVILLLTAMIYAIFW